jgi:hypothetical protein
MKIDEARFSTGNPIPRQDHVLKNGRKQSNYRGMMSRLIRLMVAVVIATVLIGAPVLQAAIAMPCDIVATSVTDHLLSSGQTPAPVPLPCKGTMPGRTGMVGCGLGAGLLNHATVASHQLTWTSAIYQAVADVHAGLSLKPDLGPPITI